MITSPIQPIRNVTLVSTAGISIIKSVNCRYGVQSPDLFRRYSGTVPGPSSGSIFRVPTPPFKYHAIQYRIPTFNRDESFKTESPPSWLWLIRRLTWFESGGYPIRMYLVSCRTRKMRNSSFTFFIAVPNARYVQYKLYLLIQAREQTSTCFSASHRISSGSMAPAAQDMQSHPTDSSQAATRDP